MEWPEAEGTGVESRDARNTRMSDHPSVVGKWQGRSGLPQRGKEAEGAETEVGVYDW